MLDRAAAQVGDSFASQPEVEAAIQTTIAEAYYGLGEQVKSEEHYRRAVDLLRRTLGPEHPETLRVDQPPGHDPLESGPARSEAEALLRRNLEACRRVLGPEHPETLSAIRGLASPSLLPAYAGRIRIDAEGILGGPRADLRARP